MFSVIAFHSISLAGLNLNIQVRGLYFSKRKKGNFFLQTFINVYLFNRPFRHTVLNAKLDNLPFYFPIIKTTLLIALILPIFYLKDLPSHSILLVWANKELSL